MMQTFWSHNTCVRLLCVQVERFCSWPVPEKSRNSPKVSGRSGTVVVPCSPCRVLKSLSVLQSEFLKDQDSKVERSFLFPISFHTRLYKHTGWLHICVRFTTKVSRILFVISLFYCTVCLCGSVSRFLWHSGRLVVSPEESSLWLSSCCLFLLF